MTSVGFKDDNRKWQIGTTKVFMKEDVRQILERELGNALVSHAVVIQKMYKRHLFRKHIKATLSCRTIRRYFKIVQRHKQFAAKYIKANHSIRVIAREYKAHLKRKRRAKLLKEEKANAEKLEIDRKMREIEEERQRLDKLRENQQRELLRLDSNDNHLITDFDFDDSGIPDISTAGDPEFLGNYMTPGNPDLDESEYKYDDDAFKEDLDGLSDKIDDDEIAEFQNRILELENQVQNLENEKDEFERKYLKETNNRQYLESQIEDYEQKIAELKDK